MPNTYMNLDADKAAVAKINFCGSWPNAKAILQQVAAVVKNPFVKSAIAVVILACDAYCQAHPVNSPQTT